MSCSTTKIDIASRNVRALSRRHADVEATPLTMLDIAFQHCVHFAHGMTKLIDREADVTLLCARKNEERV